MRLPDPTFPPLLKGHSVKATAKVHEEASRRAAARDLSAGDIVWSRNTSRAELAVVLEPDVPLGQAFQMAPLMMVALGDCLGALCPPQVAVLYRWPGIIVLNGAPAGMVRTAAPSIDLSEQPDWLVVSVQMQIAAPKNRKDWSTTSLADEGGAAITRSDLLQSTSAHFLTWLNIWQDDGFRPVHDQWLFRAEGRDGPIGIEHDGEHMIGTALGLDENANLLLKPVHGPTRALSFSRCVDFVADVGNPR